jgi:hypothetical protein
MKCSALLLLLALPLLRGAPTPSPPPLCQVQAMLVPSPVAWLTSITLQLRPGCPAAGSAQVRLRSDLGSTDPPGGWLLLTPCTSGQHTCRADWRGVLLRPLNWRPQWRAASGRPYDIPIQIP